MFRRFMNSGLRDAKNFVDARETQLKLNEMLDYE